MILSMTHAAALTKTFQSIYEKEGVSAVYTFANKTPLKYNYCKACEAETPTIETTITRECAICGQAPTI